MDIMKLGAIGELVGGRGGDRDLGVPRGADPPEYALASGECRTDHRELVQRLDLLDVISARPKTRPPSRRKRQRSSPSTSVAPAGRPVGRGGLGLPTRETTDFWR